MDEEGSARDQRFIRVFVSSTFQDMQPEREHLVKQVFPRLRELCESRGIVWSEVDLRWGIPPDQMDERQLLSVCLEEIDRCRPYFIGVLGERYGFVPQQISSELITRYPWLQWNPGCSITEVEFLHGALNAPAGAGRARFYLRQAASPAGPVTDSHNASPAEDLMKDRLNMLKSRLRSSGLSVAEYAGPEDLAARVLADYTEIINEEYPATERTDVLDRDAADQAAFALSRREIYLPDQSNFDALDALALGAGPPIMVFGEPGCGKSALLANWTAAYRDRYPDVLMVSHFVGAGRHHATREGMLSRIMAELIIRFDLQVEIPKGDSELNDAFANCLQMAAARGRVVLVLDGLNQLAHDNAGALDLTWLPSQIPANVRLVLSAGPGRAYEAARRRGWPILQLEPLPIRQRLELIGRLLASYGKSLTPSQTARIAEASATHSPLFLRTLLEDLRTHGDYKTLDRRIDHYLSAEDPKTLYQLILRRYEEDYETRRPGLVRDAMSLIWAARRGLAESELLDVLGTGEEPLPSADWIPLYTVARYSLINQAGLLGFAHQQFRDAVESTYLPTGPETVAAHQRLAAYFQRCKFNYRVLDEGPWQLARSRDWTALYRMLRRPTWTSVTSEIVSSSEVHVLWTELEEHTNYRMVDTYGPALESLELDRFGERDAPSIDAWVDVASRMLERGYAGVTLPFWEKLAARRRASCENEGLAFALHALTSALTELGDFERARKVLEEQEELCRRTGNRKGLAAALVDRAWTAEERDPRAAMPWLEEAEKIAEELHDPQLRGAILTGRARLLQASGCFRAAGEILADCEKQYRELGYRHFLVRCLTDRAKIMSVSGDLDSAADLCREAVTTCRDLGIRQPLARALDLQAELALQRNDAQGAAAHLAEAERVYRAFGPAAELVRNLCQQAWVALKLGNDAARRRFESEAERLCTAAGPESPLRYYLPMHARILSELGKRDEAAVVWRRCEDVCRSLRDPIGTVAPMIQRALLLDRTGDFESALSLFVQAQQLSEESGLRGEWAKCLWHRSVLLGMRLHRLEEALPLAEQARDASLELGLRDISEHAGEVADFIRKEIRASEGKKVSRVFPEVTASLYGSSPAPRSTAEGQWTARDILSLARPPSGEPHRLARLMVLHRSAFESECSGKCARADFYWREFQREFRKIWVDGLSEPDQLRQALLDEIFLDAHRAFYNRFLPDPDVADLENRGFTHLEYLLELLVHSSIDEARRLALAGRGVAAMTRVCFERKKWRRGIRVVSWMLNACPDCEYFQDRLYGLVFQQHALEGMRVPFTGLLQRRLLRRKIKTIEKLRNRFPYRPVAYEYLSTLHARLAYLLDKAGYRVAAMGESFRAVRISPKLDPTADRSNDEYLARHTVAEILEQGVRPSGLAIAHSAYQYTRDLWRLIGLNMPLAASDPRPLSLYSAMQSVREAAPASKADLLVAWAREVDRSSDLKDFDSRAVCSYLEFLLLGPDSQPRSTEFPPAPPDAPRIAIPFYRQRTSFPPLLAWLVSRQGLLLKAAALGLTIALAVTWLLVR